jgi:hypothetical protein
MRHTLPTDKFLSIPDAIAGILAAEGSSASVEVHAGIGCTKPSPTLQVCTAPKRNDKLVQEAVTAAAGATQVVLMLNLQSLAPCTTPQKVADGEEFNPCGYEAEQADRPHSTPPKLQNEMALAVLKAAAAAKVAIYTVHYTLYTIHHTLCTVHYTLCTIHYTIHHTPYTIHHTPYTIHYTLYIILFFSFLSLSLSPPFCRLFTHTYPYTPHILQVPVAVVLVHGGGMAIDEIKASANAIVDAHYPGAATGGPAVAELLYGRYSPAGKMPYSLMPKAFDALSNFSQMSLTAPPGRTYRYYPTSKDLPAPLWPFGWGLTYTQWEITLTTPSSVPSSVPSSGTEVVALPATFTVELKNVGAVASDEVVQVYFAPQFLREGCPTPTRQLIDFERLHVAAGASASVSFTVTSKQLELAGIDGSRASHPGKYTLEFTNGVGTNATADITIG